MFLMVNVVTYTSPMDPMGSYQVEIRFGALVRTPRIADATSSRVKGRPPWVWQQQPGEIAMIRMESLEARNKKGSNEVVEGKTCS